MLPSNELSLLSCAVMNDNDNMVNYLLTLPEIKLDSANQMGLTAVHYAAQRGNVSCVAKFNDMNTECFTYRDKKGRSPLHLAVDGNAHMVVDWFAMNVDVDNVVSVFH